MSVKSTSRTLRTKTASLSTGSTGTLSGVVFNTGGKLLSGATVSLRLSNGSVKSTTSSHERRLEALEPAARPIHPDREPLRDDASDVHPVGDGREDLAGSRRTQLALVWPSSHSPSLRFRLLS
jgi:hypothetical protein